MQKNYLSISFEKAYQKIKYYCNYQERSHYEVKEKLYSFGLYKKDVEVLLAQLIEENFLNEERFAKAFVRGKFNLKKWGRKKIEQELYLKKVSIYNIRRAFEQIDNKIYTETLKKLASTKWNSLKNEQYINRQVKTTRFLLQKGYENNLIKQVLLEIREVKDI